MGTIQLSQGCTATIKREITLTTKSPEVLGTHLIDLRVMKDSEPLN